MSSSSDTAGRRLAVFAVTDGKGLEGKARWTRIGAAFENRDGSINLILNALPLGTDRLQVRPDREDEHPPASPRRAAPRIEPRIDPRIEEVRT